MAAVKPRMPGAARPLAIRASTPSQALELTLLIAEAVKEERRSSATWPTGHRRGAEPPSDGSGPFRWGAYSTGIMRCS